MLWNLSWPAVSQTCIWIFLPLYSIVLILKSTPIVVMKLGSNSSPANLFKIQVLPTEELPINKTLKIWSVLPLPLSVDIFGKIENSYRRKFQLIWHLNACSKVSHEIMMAAVCETGYKIFLSGFPLVYVYEKWRQYNVRKKSQWECIF